MEIFKLFGSILIDNNKANESLDSTDKKASNVATTLGKGVKVAGKWALGLVTAAGTVATAIGGLVVKSTDDMQKALNGLQAATGSTDSEMEEFKNTMLEVYNSNFGENFEEIGNTMTSIRQQTGAAGEELKKLTEGAFILRDTFGYEVNESTRAAKAMMDQFGISGEQAYNLIAQGAQQGLDFSGELIDSIVEYSVHFKKAGMSATDMFNIMLSGAQSGAFNLDKVGDAVKEFNIRLVDGSSGTAEALKALGLNADEVASVMSQGGEKAQQMYYKITESLANMDDKQKQNIVGTQLFGTMWEDLGSDVISSLQNMNDAFNENIDTIGQINEVKYDSFGEAVQGIKRNLETGILIPLGEGILPLLNESSNWFLSNMPSIQSYVQRLFNNLGPAFAQLIPMLGTVISTLLPQMLTIVQQLLPLFSNFAVQILPPLANIFGQLVTTLLPPLMNLFQVLVTTILPPLMEIINVLATQVLPPLLNAFSHIINTLLPPLIELFQIIINTIMPPLMDIINLFVNEVMPPLIDVFILVADVIGMVIQVINPLIQAVLPLLAEAFKLHFESIGQKVKIVVEGIKGYIEGVKKIFSGLIDFITGVFTGNWSRAWEGVKSIFSGVFESLKNIFKTPINFIIEGINKFIRGLNKIQIPDWVPAVGGKGINIKEIPMLASGTDYWKGGPAIINEVGGEIVDLPRGARVIPHDVSMEMARNSEQTIMQNNQPIYLQVDGYTFAKLINPYGDRVSGTNIRLFERGLIV